MKNKDTKFSSESHLSATISYTMAGGRPNPAVNHLKVDVSFFSLLIFLIFFLKVTVLKNFFLKIARR